MERKSFAKFLFLFAMCLCLTGMTVSTCNAQWWSSSSSTSSSSGSGSSDTIAPTITSFTAPSSVASRTIPIKSFRATDNVRVTGYCVFVQGDYCNWTSSPPKYYTPIARYSGSVTIMGQAKDAAGNISATATATVTGVPVAVAPDLVVTKVVHPATTITQSVRTFQVTDTVTNQGKATASASKTKYTLYYVYESRGPNGEYTKIMEEYGLTGTRSVPEIKSGASSTGTVTVTVPSGVRVRSFQVKAYADSEKVVDELDEGNNDKNSGTTTISVKE